MKKGSRVLASTKIVEFEFDDNETHFYRAFTQIEGEVIDWNESYVWIRSDDKCSYNGWRTRNPHVFRVGVKQCKVIQAAINDPLLYKKDLFEWAMGE